MEHLNAEVHWLLAAIESFPGWTIYVRKICNCKKTAQKSLVVNAFVEEFMNATLNKEEETETTW